MATVTDALTALHERYRASLPEKRGAIMSAFAAWRADTARLEPLRELGRLLHKLAGSAGGYGFTHLGEAARTADGLIGDWLADAPDDASQRHVFVLALEPLLRGLDDLFEAGQAASPAVPATTGARKIKMVLVDDDSELSLLLTEQLRHEGIEVIAAHDGAGMHVLLSQARPDILVLDFWLRDETGDELARAVRRIPGFATLPAVCLTSDRTPETRQRALGAGALEVIDKSTPLRQLAGLLKTFAGGAA